MYLHLCVWFFRQALLSRTTGQVSGWPGKGAGGIAFQVAMTNNEGFLALSIHSKIEVNREMSK